MILGDEAWFVHVSYGGRKMKDAFEGPFSDRAEAERFAIVRHDEGFGASVYRCMFEVTGTWLAMQRDSRIPR